MAGREMASPPGLASAGLRTAHNGLRRGQVAEIQRVRMLTAMVEEAAGRGVGNVTVAHVVGRSGVSRRTFYEQFEDREACFLAAFDECVSRIAHVVVPAYEREARWRDGVRSAMAELLGFLEGEPAAGRLVVVESLSAGPVALEYRRRVVKVLVGVIQRGSTDGRGARKPPVLTADGVVGAVMSILHARLSEDPSRGCIDLLNPLMAMIVLPYLGRTAADRELDRPAVARRRDGPRPRADPLRELEMRLTYRTVRVLLAVAADPGSSNRSVADGAGITDQGQISKLLSRLQGLGLIENTGGGPARGEPNAWILTTKGWEVHSAIAQQTNLTVVSRTPASPHPPGGS
jgi:AcrR family transcriptional regulator